MSYGISYKPRRITYRNFRNKNCKCPPKVLFNTNTSGNIVSSGFLSTKKYTISNEIKNATNYSSKGTKHLTYANKQLNAFGSWNGANNIRKKLRNSF